MNQTCRRLLEKQGRTNKWCSPMGPHIWPRKKQDDQLECTYSSYVRIWDIALKTSQSFFENYFVCRISLILVSSLWNIVFPEVCQKQEIRSLWSFRFVWVSCAFPLVFCHLKEKQTHSLQNIFQNLQQKKIVNEIEFISQFIMLWIFFLFKNL